MVKLGSSNSNADDDDSTSSSDPTAPGTLPPVGQLILPILQTVRERGFLRCKAERLGTEKGVGFTIDLVSVCVCCRDFVFPRLDSIARKY